MTTTNRIARETVLWIGGVLGALCLTMLAAGWLFNVTPLVFASGSMSPAYEAGDLGVAREVPADQLGAGDVVSVMASSGERVTHRVVEVAPAGDRFLLTLQGDTNSTPDAESYLVASADRVDVGIPYAGYVLNAAASPFGLMVIVLLVLASLWLGFARPAERGRPAGPARLLVPVGVFAVAAAACLLGATGQASWAFTSAYWTDSATVTATATTPATPVLVISCVRNANDSITLSWTKTNAGYTYDWQRRAPGSPTGPGGSGGFATGGTGLGAATPVNGVVTLTLATTSNGTTNWDIAVTTKLSGASVGTPAIQQIGRQGSFGLFCSYQQ